MRLPESRQRRPRSRAQMIKALMIRNTAARQRQPVAPSVAQILPGQGESSPVPVRIAAGTQPPIDPKVRARQTILHGPVLATMLSLAGPTILVLLAQVAVGVAETFYVSYLGTAALAGVALVFPILMLMTMMSNGGVGGGVASAVARAIGAGRNDDADALVTHALVVAMVFGLLFTAMALLFGRAVYGALGGTGAVLDAALTYSTFVFIGAVPIWIVNLMASALRGAGNVKG